MEQLKKTFYSTSELAELTGAKEADKKHFKRNVESILTKWGYGSDWVNGHGTRIIHVPEMPEERLQEILIRQFHVDIQTEMYYFACFVTAFTDIPNFDSMPWAIREKEYEKYSGKFITSRTLSKWCRQLIEHEIISKGESGTYWKTTITTEHEKVREIISEAEAQEYFRRRSELVEKCAFELLKKTPSLSLEQAQRKSWKSVYQNLWGEFKCCCYFCKSFRFFAWNTQGWLAEVFELTREISGKEERINGKLR